MTHTNNVQLNLLSNHQIYKEILINENSVLIDAMLFNGIESDSLIEAPQEPLIGQKFIIPDNAVNDWEDKKNNIAVKLEQRWVFIEPRNGMLFWIIDKEKLVVYTPNGWQEIKVAV